MVATVLRLGLELRPNVSVPRELKTLARLDAHRFAVIDVGTNSVKFHLGERAPTAAGGRSTTARRSPASARASTGRGELQPEPIAAPSRRSPRWRTRRRRRGRSRSPRSAPPGCGSPPTRDVLVDAVRDRTRRRGRGHLRRGGEPARLPSRRSPRRAGRGDALWCSTPAAAVRSSRSATARRSTSASAWTSAPCASPSASGLTEPVDDATARRRRWRRSPPTSACLDGRPSPDARRRHGRRRDEPHGRHARTRATTTPTRCRARCSRRPRSSARSSCTARGRPTQRRSDRWAAAGAGGGDPRGRVCRAHGPDASSAATRSRSAITACATALLAERFGQHVRPPAVTRGARRSADPRLAAPLRPPAGCAATSPPGSPSPR